MKRINLAVLFVLLFGVVAGSCASVTKDIRIEGAHDPKVNFGALKTYAFVGGVKALVDSHGKWAPSDLDLGAEIVWLVEKELRARNFTAVTVEPDVYVAFALAADMDALVAKYDKDNSVWFIENVPTGALFVALIDPVTEEAIWLGAAVADIQDDPKEETVKTRLDYAVKEIFSTLPK
jgi:hypothetical protein